MAGVITIEVNDGADMKKADVMIKTMLNALSHEQMQTIDGCNYQEVVMSIEVPRESDNFDPEDFGV